MPTPQNQQVHMYYRSGTGGMLLHMCTFCLLTRWQHFSLPPSWNYDVKPKIQFEMTEEEEEQQQQQDA